MKTRIFCALLSAIMGILVTSCDKDDCAYSSDNRIIPTPQTQPEPEKPTSVTFNKVMDRTAVVREDTTVRETLVGAYTNDSLVTRELIWSIAPVLEGPSYMVVMDSLPTVNCGADRPVTTEGAWHISASGDSLKTDVTTSDFKFSYYGIEISTSNTMGYANFSGLWEPYLPASITTSLNSFKSEWLGDVEREDSLFKREKTTQSFIVSARTSMSSRSFLLTKEVIIDHFLKIKEEEVVPTPDPTPNPTITADYWAAGLQNFMYGFRVYREDTKRWSDAYSFRTETGYFILVANYMIKNDKEQFLSFEEHTVSKSICPWTSAYNGVIFHDGKFYPAVATPVDGKYEKGWNLVATINGSKVTKGIDANSAVKQGLKNFQGDNTAYPTPVIPTTATPKVVDGKKVIDFVGKTSVHTVAKTVADASLKK